MSEQEVTLIKNVVLILFLVELVGLLTSYFLSTGTTTPALNSLNRMSLNLQNETTSLVTVLNYTAIPQSKINSDSQVALTGGIVAFFDTAWNIISIPIHAVILILSIVFGFIVLVVYIGVFVIPSIISALNIPAFSLIFGAGYLLFILFLGLYLTIMFKDQILGFFGWVAGKI